MDVAQAVSLSLFVIAGMAREIQRMSDDLDGRRTRPRCFRKAGRLGREFIGTKANEDWVAEHAVGRDLEAADFDHLPDQLS
jgi:hypothetical protein